MTAAIIACSLATLMIGLMLLSVHITRTLARESDERQAQREAAADERTLLHELEMRQIQTGTLVPPGWNALVSGQQAESGHWVPPGFNVVMAPGEVHDAFGNSISGGSDNILWHGEGNTFIGQSHTRRGVKPY